MPANVAHMLIAHKAVERLKANGDGEFDKFVKILDDSKDGGNHQAYMNLGSIGPDLFYYVDIGRSLQDIFIDRYMRAKAITQWPYNLHSNRPNVFPLKLIEILFTDVEREGNKVDLKEEDKCKLAYIGGHLTHIAADQIIHPLVNRIAGPYYRDGKNRKTHREAEIYQDYFLYEEVYRLEEKSGAEYEFLEQKFHKWIDCVKSVDNKKELFWYTVRYVLQYGLPFYWNLRRWVQFFKRVKFGNTRGWFRYFLQRGFAETYGVYPSERKVEDSVDNLLLVLCICRKFGPYKKAVAAYKKDGQGCWEYREYIKNQEKKVNYMECYKEAVELSVAYLEALYKVYRLLKEGKDFTDKRKWFREVVSGADLACPLETGILEKAKSALTRGK